MGDGKVRTLCAQIAVELDPRKSAALIEELTETILHEYLKITEASDQQLGTAFAKIKPS